MVHIVIHYIALGFGVYLQTLHDVVGHLQIHVGLLRGSEVSHKHGYQQDDACDDDSAQTATCELLGERLVSLEIGVLCLIHICFRFDYYELGS